MHYGMKFVGRADENDAKSAGAGASGREACETCAAKDAGGLRLELSRELELRRRTQRQPDATRESSRMVETTYLTAAAQCDENARRGARRGSRRFRFVIAARASPRPRLVSRGAAARWSCGIAMCDCDASMTARARALNNFIDGANAPRPTPAREPRRTERTVRSRRGRVTVIVLIGAGLGRRNTQVTARRRASYGRGTGVRTIQHLPAYTAVPVISPLHRHVGDEEPSRLLYCTSESASWSLSRRPKSQTICWCTAHTPITDASSHQDVPMTK